MRGMMRLIWGEHKAEYFFRDDWTGVIGIEAAREISFYAHADLAHSKRTNACRARDLI
jgi:hypothetical protein